MYKRKMFCRKVLMLFAILIVSSLMSVVQAQVRTITGQVKDDAGVTVPGASVVIKGTTTGTTTDFDGKFSIRASDGDLLEISFVGYKKKTIKVSGDKPLEVNLESDTQQLGEVQVVAFGKQKKSSMIGAITTINTKELRVSSSNLTTAFAGKLAGVIAYQTGGDPSQQNVNFFVRGVSTMGASSSPLILIDGIESSSTDLARLQPDDIATFSILKDATATALYGARGANGILLVTTKEGKEGKVKINIRSEMVMTGPTDMVDVTDPITYMQMHNEATATRNPLAVQLYSQDKIDNTIRGVNPYVYPSIDWQEMLFKKHSTSMKNTFSLSGGSKFARYYVGGTYNVDNGMLKANGENNFNNNVKLSTYQLRSNVNVNITKTTEIIMRLGITVDNYNGPIDGATTVFQKATCASPVLFPAYYPKEGEYARYQHILFGNYDGTGNYPNPYADLQKGYREYDNSKIVSSFEIKQKLDMVTKGLSARALFSTDRYSHKGSSRSYNPFYYFINTYDPITNQYTLTNLNPPTLSANGGTEYLNYNPETTVSNSTTYFEGAINYDRTFAEKHSLSGLLVGYVREYKTSEIPNGDTKLAVLATLPYRNAGLSGRLAYGYKDTYFVEGNFGYNGSERFAANHRWGFFPSVGIGWLASNEKFMEPLQDIVSKLKFRLTYGLVGNDQLSNNPADRYFYLSNVNVNDAAYGATFGERFSEHLNGVSIGRYANDEITWELSKKWNLGVELELFRALELQVDIFKDNRSNILITRSNLPSSAGLLTSVQANAGSLESHGVDIVLDYNKAWRNGFWITSHNTFTYSTNKVTKYDEPDYETIGTPWRSRIGQNWNQKWGYIAERLFVDDNDIANSPTQQFGKVMAGDIKYKDINGDGKVNTDDLVPIGFPTVPAINFGFGVSMGYKGFDVSCFFQGTGKRSLWIDPVACSPFVNRGTVANGSNLVLQDIANSYWSESNRNCYALWPRLSTTRVSNNEQPSTWYMRDASFLRFKSLEVGYTFPKKLLRNTFFESIRIYYTGTNLCVFSKFKMWDPELGGAAFNYPIQSSNSFGIQVNI
jgi:TonB-linked SusC/RagA family outer membrane protein